jgi:integrase
MSATLGAVQTVMETGLIRRGGRYSIRRVIPLDLQPHYGRREIVRALGTADPKEAKRLHALARVSLDREFDAARKAADEAPPRPAGPPAKWLAMTPEQRAQWHREKDEYDLGAIEADERDQLEEFATQRSAVGEAIAQARLRWEAETRDERAFFAEEAVARAKAAPQGVALTEVVKRWAAERKPIPRTVRRAENIIDRFEAVVGNLPVDQITRQHVLDFKDKMLATGTPANTNVLLTILGVVLNYAADNNLIPTNPAAKIKVQDKRLAKDKRDIFNEAALSSIFGSAIYVDGDRPLAAGGEAAYWLPLLALYTGARLDELGQLHPDDVHRESYRDGDEEKTAWVIRFIDNEERGQHLKSESARRRVPVHADLIALGFVEIAQAALAAGRGRIFYKLRPASDGKETGNYSKWFGRYRRSKLGLKGKDTPFHSFRHTFKHYSRLASIPADVHNEITGHETGDVADNYGGMSYPLAPLVEGIRRYRVPGFKLPAAPSTLYK